MQFSKIRPLMSISTKIKIDIPKIILVLPDVGVDIKDCIYNSNIYLSQCKGIISRNTINKFHTKKIMMREHILELRKKLKTFEDEQPDKKITLFNQLPVIDDDKLKTGFYFYDLSYITKGVSIFYDNFADKLLVRTIFNHISQTYSDIKQNFPTVDVELMFFFNSVNTPLYNLFLDIKTLLPRKDLETLSFFDTFGIINNMEYNVPFFMKEKGKTKLILTGYNKLKTFLSEEVESPREIIDTSKTIPFSVKPNDLNVNADIISATNFLKNNKTETKDDILNKINLDELKTALQKHKITDSTVLANTKIALDNYNSKKLNNKSSDEISDVVLKAIHYTIHGNDEIKEEYLHNPKLLINKIKDIKTYQVPLEFPENIYSIEPKDIIDIKHTSGQFRQKFEYDEAVHDNVKKLFATIEKLSNHPVKVKKIEYEIKDNDRDRYIDYQITLQNLSGINTEPYTVELKVPSIVNDRYFKLHGKMYIQSNQQILKPVTKTDPAEVRLLSNYAIVHVRIKNIKFNPADILQLTNYIKIKYSHIIESSDYISYIKFKDNSTIYLNNSKIYESDTQNINISEDSVIKDEKTNNIIKYGKNELIFQLLRSKIQQDNPSDILSTTKKNLPYLEIYLSGISMPLIIYLWSQKGLLNTFNDLEINYRIIDNLKNAAKNEVIISLDNNTYIAAEYNNIREELLLNGIIQSKLKNINSDVNNIESIYPHIISLYGSRSILKINLITENEIDPITKELLEFEGMNTNFPNLVSQDMLDILLNKKPQSLANLSIYRSRLSEFVLHSMYKQIKMAHNKYRSECEMGMTNSKIYLDPNFLINSLLTENNTLMQYGEPYNPLDEIMLASRAIKTGIGGTPSKRVFKTQHRNIHESQYGNIGAISTPESGNVGLILHHTLTPIISNKWGSYGAKDISKLSGWNILALDEALIMLQSSMDSDRACMARAHANQVVPINNAQSPYVMTGGEFLVPQLASKRFIQKPKQDGKVIEFEPNKYITIEYKNGKTEVFDLLPRSARTKRGSVVSLHMICNKKIGDIVTKNEILAHTKNFDNNGIYASGTNVFIAMLNYEGFSHEDAYVISDELANNTTVDMIKEVFVVIPPNTKLLNIEHDIGKQVKANDILLEFVYENDIDDYIDTYELEDIIDEENSEEDNITNYSKGKNTIKLLSSVDGEIVDFKIYINNKKVTDKKAIDIHSKLVANDHKIIQKLQQNNKQNISALDNIKTDYMKIGGHKLKGNKDYEGAKVVYYIKYQKPLRIGDKIASRSALKGVVSKVLKEQHKGEFTPKIDVFVSPGGIFSRKNMSILKELYIGKIFYFLNSKVKELCSDNKIEMNNIIKFILSIYKELSTEKIYNAISTKLNEIKPNILRKSILNDEFKLFFVIEPFTNVTFKQIKIAAKILGIPLDEKVYFPELGVWSKNPVPVGVAYYQFLEHHSDVYSNIRGSERYVGLTKSPTKGKSKLGGQSLGNLDINALITLEADSIIKEMFTLRSDEHKSKRESYSDIIFNGDLINLTNTKHTGGTHQIFNIYMTSLGLEMTK